MNAFILILLVVILVLLLVLMLRRTGVDLGVVERRLDGTERLLERGERGMREEVARNRDELSARFQQFSDSLLKQMAQNTQVQGQKLDGLAKVTEERFDRLQARVEQKLQAIQEDNTRKLEEMRKTVDEKLQGTLEKRLGESFKQVSDRLEQVHRGLGEMHTLANGVGDLTKALTNVKVRGTWGEIQLESLLEQVLTPDQYVRNAKPHEGSAAMVEFAIRLPGRDEFSGQEVLLPIDSKYPREDYDRLIDASEKGELQMVEAAGRSIEQQIKREARTIREKYIDPPHTTDFAILFLPIEGLYAEVVRRPGLVEYLQREYRVNVAGPTTLAALLNSLQMGFRTLAIQKRTSEVWEVLGAVKTQFEKFGDVIERVQKKLQEASSVIEDKVAVRTRVINRKLRKIQDLPIADARKSLGELLDESEDEDAEGEGPPVSGSANEG